MDLLAMQRLNEVSELLIPLDDIIEGLTLSIFPEGSARCFTISDGEAFEKNESPYQILEGNFYEFEIIGSIDYTLDTTFSGIVQVSKRNYTRGRLCPNIFVGKLTIRILNTRTGSEVKRVYVEVLPVKLGNELDPNSYRVHYQRMLEDITKRCTELLMQVNAPVNQSFTMNFSTNSLTLYQRFSFVKALIHSEDFENAIHQIIKNPATKWTSYSEEIPIQNNRRFDRKAIRQLMSGTNRICSDIASLNAMGINHTPKRLISSRKIESVDTVENRFIKHALTIFLQFVGHCQTAFSKNKLDLPLQEANTIWTKLNSYLSFPFFRVIESPSILKINSPLLQKRAGYRELLNRWLQFDLAAQLIWKGGEDIYEAGKKDIATLYEYWLFFMLYELVKDKFDHSYTSTNGNPFGDFIESTPNGLNLRLKSGKHMFIQGICDRYSRNLGYRFSYNRSFTGGTDYATGKAGSWTTSLRPDYTLSFWPATFSEIEAEKIDAIVHIHFDAKYKVDNFKKEFVLPKFDDQNDDLTLEVSLDIEKINERRGTYKNIDLLKMHAYKDAIRRTGGAYILYPGDVNSNYINFREIIPGLGAFPINPADAHLGLGKLGIFIDSVVEHLLDRTSERERIANHNYSIWQKGLGYRLRDSNSRLDKKYVDLDIECLVTDSQLSLLSDEDSKLIIKGDTFFKYPASFDYQKINPLHVKVLIAYYQTENWEWISKNSMINLRTETRRGSLRIQDYDYLLLHASGELVTKKFYKITGDGPRIFSKQKLEDLTYPSEPGSDFYLMYSFTTPEESEFNNLSFDIRKLLAYQTGSNSVLPFSVSLVELLESIAVA